MLDKFFSAIERFVPVKWRWVLGHGGFRRYFANTGWMFFGQMFGLLLAFFVGAYVARYLGPEDFGLMSYSISFVGLFGFLAGFGIDSILNRELIKFPEKKKELLSTSFWIKLLGGLLAILIINVVSFFVNNDYLSKLLIFIFSLTFVFQSFNIFSLFFQSKVLSRKVVQVQILCNVLSALMKILFIYFNLGLIFIISLYIFDNIILAIGLICIYYKDEKNINLSIFDKKILKSLLRDSLPLMFSIVAITVYSKIDQIIINKMLNETSVGIYSVAVKISECWYFVPGLICSSLLPAIINSKKTDSSLYKKRINFLYFLLLVFGSLMAFMVFVLSKPIILLMFGLEYIESIKVSQIYAWSIIPTFVMSGFWSYLLSENYTKVYLVITIIGAISNIVLNILLIPHFGIIGSAYATLVSYALTPLSLFMFRNNYKNFLLIFK